MARKPPVVRSRTPASTMTTEARAWAPPPPEPITWAAAIAFFVKHIDHGERETVIRRGAGENTWRISTNDPSIIRKLQRRYPDGKQLYWGGHVVVDVPTRCIRFGPLEVSEAKRAAGRRKAEALQAAKRPIMATPLDQGQAPLWGDGDADTYTDRGLSPPAIRGAP